MSADDSNLSPEIGLLDRLVESDVSLTVAVALFPRIDRAKRALETYVRSEAVELICRRDGEELVVQPWRLRFVLNDPDTWGANADGSIYHLHLTAAAQQRCVADSQSFAEELFQRSVDLL
jgi:hypothetical protein